MRVEFKPAFYSEVGNGGFTTRMHRHFGALYLMSRDGRIDFAPTCHHSMYDGFVTAMN